MAKNCLATSNMTPIDGELAHYTERSQFAIGRTIGNQRLSRLSTGILDLGGSVGEGSHLMEDQRFVYDLMGNVVSIEDRSLGSGARKDRSTGLRLYSYDGLYLLRSAKYRMTAVEHKEPWVSGSRASDPRKAQPVFEEYAYSASGSPTSVKRKFEGNALVRSFIEDPTEPNRPREVVYGELRVPYTYDLRGNMTSEFDNRMFTWDAQNRLARFENRPIGSDASSVIASYAYDADGGRRIKTVLKNGGLYEITLYVAPELIIVRGGSTNGTVRRGYESRVLDGDIVLMTLDGGWLSKGTEVGWGVDSVIG